MSTNTQRRHFTRIPFDTDYRLHSIDGKQHWQGMVIDLSIKGALLHRPDSFHANRGDNFLLDLILNQEGMTIQMEVTVAHLHEIYVGFECHHIDIDSMTHLRRVLELNLGDPHLLEREINEMIQLNQH